MKRINGDKTYVLVKKKRKQKTTKENSCRQSNTKTMCVKLVFNYAYIDKSVPLLSFDAPYYDHLLEKEISISNEYITPFLKKRFESTAVHAAIPIIENKIAEWNKTTEIETSRETEMEVETERKFESENTLKQCVEQPFYSGKKNIKQNDKLTKQIDMFVKENDAEELGLSTVKTNAQKNVHNIKEKQTNMNTKTAVISSNNTTIKINKLNTMIDTTKNNSNMNKNTNTKNKTNNTSTTNHNKGSTKVEVLRIDLKNLHYKMKTPEKKNPIRGRSPNPFLIKQNISQEKKLSICTTNILNEKNTCNMSTLLCDVLNFFNCNFGDLSLNNDKSNDTEMTVYETNGQNELRDTEAPTIKSSMSINKKVISSTRNEKGCGNEKGNGNGNGNGKFDIGKSSSCSKNILQVINSESTSHIEEPLTIENTCSDGSNIETRNSNMSTERGGNESKLSNSSSLHIEENQTTLRERSNSNIRNTCTKKKNKRGKGKKKKKEGKTNSIKNRHTFLDTTNNPNKLNIINNSSKKKGDFFTWDQEVDENIVFIQIENFSRKIEEYIADEKIFKAQKLIEHVKKYTEFYINYFQQNESQQMAEKLLNYYNKNYKNNNVIYNINTLKSHIILHFLNFFHLTEMIHMLNEHCYYFSVDPLINYDTSDTTSENNDVSSAGNDNNSVTKMAEAAVFKYPNSCSNSDIDFSKDKPRFFTFTEETNIRKLNKNKVVIVDKLYHQHFVTANIISNNNAMLDDSIIVEQAEMNSVKRYSSRGKPKHIRRLLKKYSKRLKRFRKHKRNKEGWVKENDRFLDLWYQVDNENNISVHVRAKLSYDVNRILCILNETDVSVNWAPFLTSAQKIKHLSKASAIISQLYEYPVIGKKESIMYCLGANALEELGCIILCCKAPPDFSKDILFYENMCEKLQINKQGEIITVKDIPTQKKKAYKEITFFNFLMPQPTSKIDRQRAADLCFLLYPLDDGKATVLELFLHFEVDFKYTPIKMVTYFVKKIVRNMYDNIVKCCKNYEKKYSNFLNTNKEFYDWLDKQIQKFLKNKNDIKLIDTISLRSYNEPETNE